MMLKTDNFSKILLLSGVVTTLFSNENYYASLNNLSLQSLSEVKIYSANRELKSVDEVPVVVSVITAEDIKRKGYKNLTQVLQRIPGYYMDSPAGNIITTRGITSDSNSHNLLLIDGHSQNNVSAHVFGKKATWPILLNVKRVEIIRTPSSTLWGSDAALGIINIVTFTGSDLDKDDSDHGVTRISLDYEFETHRDIENILYGVKLGEKHDLTISATHWKNPVDFTQRQTGVGTNETSPGSTIWNHNDSYDMHLKYRYKDFKFLAHLAKADMLEVVRYSDRGDLDQQMQEEANWIELQWRPKINDNLYFENRIYYDDSRDEFQLLILPRRYKQSYLDRGHKGGGGETILHLKNEQHHLKVGLFASSQELRIQMKDLNATSGIYEKSFTYQNIQDKNIAFFMEEEYSGIEDWIFTLGARWEYNTPREETTNFLPRVGIINTISDEWQVKYSYNTGYLRLPLGVNFGYYEVAKMPSFYGAHGLYEWVRSPTKSKETTSHDLQIQYNTDKILARATIFRTTLDNIVSGIYAIIEPEELYNGGRLADWGKTTGGIESRGVELELTYKYDDKLTFNTNYTYTHARYDDDYIGASLEDLTPLNVPTHLWNIGVDWDIRADLMLNVNYRGFGDIWTKLNDDSTTTIDETDYVETGTEHFVDLNLYYMPTNYMNISLYAKNITDNVGPFSNGSGYATSQLGRELGLEIQVKF